LLKKLNGIYKTIETVTIKHQSWTKQWSWNSCLCQQL
jgi:hypothetical protein